MASNPKIKLDDTALTVELREKAKRELRETEDQAEESVRELKELIKNDGTLYFGDSDEVLIRYLRPVKFYPNSAFALMKRIAQFKERHKELLEDLMPSKLETIILNEDILNVLVDRDQDGRRILYQKSGSSWNPKKAPADIVFQLMYLLHLAALCEPTTQVNGVVIILDFDGLGMSQVMAMTHSFSQRLLNFIQEAMPLRLKAVHIINQPFLFNVVWKIFKPLIKEKLANRLHLHGKNVKELHKHIHPAYLPADFGGTLPKIDYTQKDWYPVLRSLDPFIIETLKYGFKQ